MSTAMSVHGVLASSVSTLGYSMSAYLKEIFFFFCCQTVWPEGNALSRPLPETINRLDLPFGLVQMFNCVHAYNLQNALLYIYLSC